jgi:hypothetical protein
MCEPFVRVVWLGRMGDYGTAMTRDWIQFLLLCGHDLLDAVVTIPGAVIGTFHTLIVVNKLAIFTHRLVFYRRI